eukprot:3821739-Amphidinium_carterae.2
MISQTKKCVEKTTERWCPALTQIFGRALGSKSLAGALRLQLAPNAQPLRHDDHQRVTNLPTDC